ncbi:MAG: hypothetical protein ACXWVS_13615, partial [Hyphomicrobium sp.]
MVAMLLVESTGQFLGSMMALRLRALTLIASVLLALAGPCLADDAIPTPEEYSEHVGGAPILKPGELKLDGRQQVCGQRPTVIDKSLD